MLFRSGFDALRTIAVSRIYLDNFDHITAYWVGNHYLFQRTSALVSPPTSVGYPASRENSDPEQFRGFSRANSNPVKGGIFVEPQATLTQSQPWSIILA